MPKSADSSLSLDRTFGLARLDGLNGDRGIQPNFLELHPDRVVWTIGRDLDCDIVIDSQIYGMVSRQHGSLHYEAGDWWLTDCDSANGTYLNQRLLTPSDGPQRLVTGDQIILGQNGPMFEFAGAAVAPTVSPPAAPAVTLTQLFPIFSQGLDLSQKAYLLPGAITVTFVVALFMAIDRPLVFNLLLATLLAIGAYFWIYRLCGKRKPMALLVATAVVMMLLLQSPVLQWFIGFFRGVLPGNLATPSSSPYRLVQMFFGAGLMEELLKILPLLLVLGLTHKLRPAAKSRWGIVEPLDGILLGAASAIGFTLLETLGQYVPAIVQDTQLQAGLELSQLRGLQLLIPRLLGAISGHIAYSGYFGYFIGLAVLRPGHRWSIVAIGYLTAALLHALWNTMGGISPLLLAMVGMISYACLTAAIVKARSLSPDRHQNFATRLGD
jgi:RsiW-degrading membrane proteinase PrsW (M82 family)